VRGGELGINRDTFQFVTDYSRLAARLLAIILSVIGESRSADGGIESLKAIKKQVNAMKLVLSTV